MKVVIAVDSFKESLSSLEAGEAVKAGLLKAMPGAEALVLPVADGGEGTVEALALGMGGEIKTRRVTGPAGEPVDASYAVVENGRTAVIEMAAAAGLPITPAEKRNPLHTTTFGVGELIRGAIEDGCRHFIVGIGGSATNDGGAGMLQALGFGLLDAEGRQVKPGAEGLSEIAGITADKAMPELSGCSFRIACDVTNPLCGPSGCSAVFGPQKGADPKMVRDMDRWMANFAEKAALVFPGADPSYPGAGAAGGLGFAFLTFLDAKLESGVKIILDEIRLEEHVKNADIVVTGEGRLDAQTVMGKAPSGVAKAATKYGKKVIAFSGSVTPDAAVCNEHGIDAFFPILRSICTLDEAMDTSNARQNMEDTACQVFRLLKTGMELRG